jgi:transcriptional regulator with GAF, ATPase, and Fis domain
LCYTELADVNGSGSRVYGELVGNSESIRKIYFLIEQVAPSSASVLITGESGTGKELVARTIHKMSPRREKPFVAINCSAIPESLMESELFGHEKGAFTGAATRRQGCFELADTGTLLLDEIGEMPALLQAKLLRVIEERAVRRLGSRKEIEVDVRLLAATNRQPQQAVQKAHCEAICSIVSTSSEFTYRRCASEKKTCRYSHNISSRNSPKSTTGPHVF